MQPFLINKYKTDVTLLIPSGGIQVDMAVQGKVAVQMDKWKLKYKVWKVQCS